MIFVHKLGNNDKIEDFDLRKIMYLIGESDMWLFDDLEAKHFWNSDVLNFADNTEDWFIVYDSVAGTIKKMHLAFGIEVLDEEVLFNISSESVKK